MAVWRGVQSNLETQQWKTLSIEGHSFFVKGMFSVDSYEILLTDFAVMWEESLSEQSILKRSKSLNPLIEAPTSVILKQLSSRILESPQSMCSYTCNCSEDEIMITIEGPLHSGSVPQYNWQFKLTKAPPLLLKSHLVSPLLSCSIEILRRHDELIKIIDKKDKEIKDYKEGGAVVSRKHLLTLPFEEESFQNDMIKSKKFKDNSLDPVGHIAARWQAIYKDIAACKYWYNTQDISTEALSPSQPSTATDVQSPIKSPSKSPMKRGLEESPSKDIEKSRREALEKKLEESKAKMKKKKKRLM